jgi:hypothetical protein
VSLAIASRKTSAGFFAVTYIVIVEVRNQFGSALLLTNALQFAPGRVAYFDARAFALIDIAE